MQQVVRVENVAKRFGAVTALDGVSFDVPPGIVFGLLGENGAGKTTLIRILLGMIEPDEGRTSVLGLDSRREAKALRRKIGYVPEQVALYDWMTVEEIGWFTAPFYTAGFETEYRRLIAAFRLDPKAKIGSLSKGMRAKTALSLALAGDPELLILDEPTSGLDAIVRREFLESMVDRAAAGKTVFLSSHQIHEMERVADVVAILKQGKLLLVEPLDRLKQEISRVVLTLEADTVSAVPNEVNVLSRRGEGRVREWMVRASDQQHIERLVHLPGIVDAEIHAPSLEEIFVAYMQQETPGDDAPTHASVAEENKALPGD
ncbi:MAG: ABC transporter ATP-binding protein [Planctomycetota bacterium]|nr:MAG: ABC transporter ATP-binding protein [Planctomycetota bacterium]